MKMRKHFTIVGASLMVLAITLPISLNASKKHAKEAKADVDFATMITSVSNSSFDYNHIGQFKVHFNFSSQVLNYNGYVNDHLKAATDEGGNPIDLGQGLIINGQTLEQWVNWQDVDTYSAYGNVFEFPMSADAKWRPVVVNSEATRLSFRIDTAIIPFDSIEITFKAGVFKGFYGGVSYTLSEDLTYHATLDAANCNNVDSNIKFEKIVTETTNNLRIKSITKLGEQTASGGAKFQKYTVTTNIPRYTSMNSGFPHDHLRYLFDNLELNGRSFAYYNIWARGNNKDFTDLSGSVANPAYELDHPASNTSPKYNLATYIQLSTSNPYFILTIEFPNQLLADWNIEIDDVEITIRNNSAWISQDSEGNPVVRRADNSMLNAANARITEINSTLSQYRVAEREEIMDAIEDATNDLNTVLTLAEIDQVITNIHLQHVVDA